MTRTDVFPTRLTLLAQDAGEQVAETVEETAEQARETAGAIASQLPGYAWTLIKVGIVLVVAWLVGRLVRRLIRRFVDRVGGEGVDAAKAVEQKRAQTLAAVLRAAAGAVIWTIALLLALSQAGVNIGPLVAAAGIGGVALGFGAQSMVKDVIAGFFILLEDQFHVGDIVRIAGVAGAVEKITLRTTVLRDLEGRRHVVPNGEITVSTNLTSGFSRYLIDLPVPYEADLDRVIEIVRGVTDDMRAEPEYTGLMLGPLEVLGVDDYGESEIVVKVYVETMAGKQWQVGRELRRRIKNAYDAAGISIPYPHRELIVREGSAVAPASRDGGTADRQDAPHGEDR